MNEYIVDRPPGIEEAEPSPTRNAGGHARRFAFHRLFDMVCAAFGLLLLMPVLAALALVVLLDDGFPCIFRQVRLGTNGKPFLIWKFRTMRIASQGSLITAAGDRRITRAGAWLRKFKLDELPQLVNVLKGDMSLIGPRPEVPEFVDLGSPLWRSVLAVRPGVTDPATLVYRDEEIILGAFEDPYTCYRETILPAKLRLNLAYLKARTFWRDLKLIGLTVRYSLFPKSLDRSRVVRILDAEVDTNEENCSYSIPSSVHR